MNKAMATVMLIVGIAITFLFFPLVLSSMDTIQSHEVSDVNVGVATGAGVTTADVVLTEDLFKDAVSKVVSITSNNVADVGPMAATVYVPATNTLTITGLAANDTRTLTIVHDVDSLADYTGLSMIVGISPMLIWLVILGSLGAGLYGTVKS